LIEDLPGLGKTTLAKALARAVGGKFARVQCTPDLLPGDITGFRVYDQKTREFEFLPGPVFADVLLADEINRTTPRTQSALLEAMAERQVTVDGIRHVLSDTFFVIAATRAASTSQLCSCRRSATSTTTAGPTARCSPRGSSGPSRTVWRGSPSATRSANTSSASHMRAGSIAR
jgi:hypothetical protein